MVQKRRAEGREECRRKGKRKLKGEPGGKGAKSEKEKKGKETRKKEGNKTK